MGASPAFRRQPVGPPAVVNVRGNWASSDPGEEKVPFWGTEPLPVHWTAAPQTTIAMRTNEDLPQRRVTMCTLLLVKLLIMITVIKMNLPHHVYADSAGTHCLR